MATAEEVERQWAETKEEFLAATKPEGILASITQFHAIINKYPIVEGTFSMGVNSMRYNRSLSLKRGRELWTPAVGLAYRELVEKFKEWFYSCGAGGPSKGGNRKASASPSPARSSSHLPAAASSATARASASPAAPRTKDGPQADVRDPNFIGVGHVRRIMQRVLPKDAVINKEAAGKEAAVLQCFLLLNSIFLSSPAAHCSLDARLHAAIWPAAHV